VIQAGTVAAAALDARDDLGTAAMSMQWLGSLTSGMWRALSRELMTAAERLDRQSEEYLEEVSRRSRALDVSPVAVLAAGVAAGHLAQHRETRETQLPTLPDHVRRLAVPDVLFGLRVDDDVLIDDEESDEAEESDEDETADDDVDDGDEDVDDGDVPVFGIEVWLYLWPAPLSPARVRVVPDLDALEVDAEPDPSSVTVGISADDELLDALSATCGMPRDDVSPALSVLGLACWSAHRADDGADVDDEGEDEDEVDDEV